MNNINNPNTNDTDSNNTNYKKIFKRETKVIVFVVICLALVALGTSYAVFLQTSNNKDNQVVKAGSLVITYKNSHEDENGGKLTQDSDDDDKNCLAPKTDEEGQKSGCLIEFSIKNEGSLPAQYHLLIYNNPDHTPSAETGEEVEILVSLDNFKYSLTKKSTPKNGEQLENQSVGANATLGSLPKYTLDKANETTDNPSEYNNSSILETAKIDVGETLNFSLRIWLVDSAPKSLIRNPVDLKLGVIDIVYENDTAGDTVLASMGKENGIHEIMPVPDSLDSIDLDEGTSKVREFRYSGQNPDNYVYFNCTDDSQNDTCETWRILGVTEEDKDGTTERTVKLVNASETSSLTYQQDVGVELLTPEYSALNETAQQQIIDTTYKIGSAFELGITGSQMLDIERSGSTPITAKVGILTISDYLLSSSNWENVTITDFTANGENSYLTNTDNERLMNKDTDGGYYMVSSGDHKIVKVADLNQAYSEHIVVTLNKDVKITGGDGSESNPYVLSK